MYGDGTGRHTIYLDKVVILMTCDQCRWKTERGECPCNDDYKDTDYAEDCVDFRYDKFIETAFEVNVTALNY